MYSSPVHAASHLQVRLYTIPVFSGYAAFPYCQFAGEIRVSCPHCSLLSNFEAAVPPVLAIFARNLSKLLDPFPDVPRSSTPQAILHPRTLPELCCLRWALHQALQTGDFVQAFRPLLTDLTTAGPPKEKGFIDDALPKDPLATTSSVRDGPSTCLVSITCYICRTSQAISIR